MRRLLTFLVALGLSVSSVMAPSSALTAVPTTQQYPVAHLDDVPATALATIQAKNGHLKGYFLANGLLYSLTRVGSGQPTASISSVAPQLPHALSDIKIVESATGQIGVVYTCAAQGQTHLCALVESTSGTIITPLTVVEADVLDFDIAWVGTELHIAFSALDAGKNPFDGQRSVIGHAWLSADGTANLDTRSTLFVDPTVTAFNASYPTISARAGVAVMAWESYETSGANLRYVARAAVLTDSLATSRSSRVLPGTFSDVTRVRAIATNWLEGSSGFIPTVMWVGDSGVFSAAETSSGVWTAGDSSSIDAQVLSADVYASAEPALYAIVKTRHVTTPPLTSYQLTDSRVALNINTIVANAGAVIDFTGYLMPGKNPGVLLCTGSAVSLVDAVTGSVTRTKSIDSPCSETQVFDHAGAWVFLGISGQGYSATSNSPHVLAWVDSANPLDLSPSGGHVIDQQITSLNSVRILAYVVRDWTNPTTPSLTHERLLTKVTINGTELASGGSTLSNPSMAISSLTWVKSSATTVTLVWQESASTLYSTTAAQIKAATYDTETLSWSSVAVASHSPYTQFTLAKVAQPAPGDTAIGGVLIDAQLACTSCFTPPTRGLFVYSPISNAFTLASAAAGEGAPAMDAVAFADGSSGWIYATAANAFEPRVAMRSVAEGWATPALSFKHVAINPLVDPVLVSNGADSAEAGLGAVVWSEAVPGSARGSVTLRRLIHESAGGFSTSRAVTIADNSTLVGRPVFDYQGTMWLVVSSGTAVAGYEHRIISVSSSDVITRYEPFNTADAEIRAVALADTRGYVAIAVLGRDRARLFQPLNLADSRWIDLQPTNVSSPFEISGASDEFDFVIAQYKQLTVGTPLGNYFYPFPDFTPLSINKTLLGIPDLPAYPDVELLSPTQRKLTFAKGVDDPRVKLQWFDLFTGSAQSPTTDDDGVITLDVGKAGNSVNIKVRWVENQGTAQERMSPWRIVLFGGLKPADTTQFSGTWLSATSFKVTWTPPTSPFEQTFRVELAEDSSLVTRSMTTSSNSVTFTNVKPSKILLYGVRTLQFGYEAITDYVLAPPRTAPSAARSVVASKDKTALKVVWSAPSAAGSFAVTSYKVEMRIGSAAWKTVATTKAAVRVWRLLKPIKGKSYSFRVTATNGLAAPIAAAKPFVWKG